MKKVFFTLALLVFTLATYAQPTVPSDNVISVEDFDVRPGKSATFEVLLENPTATDLTAWQVYFTVPEGFELSAPEKAGRTKDGPFNISCTATVSNPNRYSVAGYSNPKTDITGTSGVIMTLTLTAPATVAVGSTHDIIIDGAKVSNRGNESLDCAEGSFTVTIVEDKLDLYDDADADPAASDATENVVLHRNLTANIWNSFVVPFNMNTTQIEEAFGEGAIVAELTSWSADNYTTGSVSEITLGFTSTDEITANKPVIVKPTKGATYENGITITGVQGITPDDVSAECIVEVPGKPKPKQYKSYFKGGYYPQVLNPSDGDYSNLLYLKSNKFYFANFDTTIKGYRGYIDLGENILLESIWEVKMLLDMDATAIDGIDADRTDGKVYTVDGKFVGKDVNFNRMQKGVYIVNGKKVIK